MTAKRVFAIVMIVLSSAVGIFALCAGSYYFHVSGGTDWHGYGLFICGLVLAWCVCVMDEESRR